MLTNTKYESIIQEFNSFKTNHWHVKVHTDWATNDQLVKVKPGLGLELEHL